MEQHGEAVEADLSRYHRVRVSDLGTAALTWRRLGVLIQYLPRESSTVQALGGDKVQWGATEHLLAAVFDVNQLANWQRGGGKGQRPKPLPRPGDGPDLTEHRMGTAIPLDEMRVILDEWGR